MRICLALLAILAIHTDADAFEIETLITNGCHEEITLDAARAAGFPRFSMAPAPTEEQQRAMHDVVFHLRGDDPWSLALFIGVRSNDLADNAPTNLEALVHVHDDPDDQQAHCIRRPEDDGSAGDVGALTACRDFIIGELEAGGLLEDSIDLTATEKVSSYYAYRGAYEVTLPRFAYRLGRAVHAVQDAYAHSMRDASTGQVRHVLNYIDAFGDNEYVEAEDGYPHLSSIDDCRRTDSHQLARIDHAREATTNIMAAIADDAPGRRDRVLAAIDAALVLMPGCDASNRYCDAPELDEPKDPRTFGCATTGGSSWLAAVLVAVAVLVRRRARLATALAIVGSAPLALAQPAPPAPMPMPGQPEAPPAPEPPAWPSVPDQPAENAPPAPTPHAPAQPTEPEQPSEPAPPAEESALIESNDLSVDWFTNHWHLDVRVGGSIDDAGAGAMVGIGRWQERWNFGALVEWNPWFSLDKLGSRAGVFNAYLTVAYRWFQGERLSIATRLEAGSSTMLFELLGLDKYTTGVYLGGALATIRFPLSKFAVTFDPIHFAMPTPRPFGVPFYYKQYRATVGIEIPF